MDWDTIVKIALTLISAIITGVVIPWLRTKTTAAQREQIAAWVKIAVAAAEQVIIGSKRGEEKKEYVKNWLRTHGIDPDKIEIDAMIEAAVFELTK